MKYYFSKYKHTNQVFYKSFDKPASVMVSGDVITVNVYPFLIYSVDYFIHKATPDMSRHIMIYIVSRGSYDSNDIFNITMGSGKVKIFNKQKEGIFLK